MVALYTKQEPRGGNVPDIAICNEDKAICMGVEYIEYNGLIVILVKE